MFEYTYMNIADKTLLEILSGEKAAHPRKHVMGDVSADKILSAEILYRDENCGDSV